MSKLAGMQMKMKSLRCFSFGDWKIHEKFIRFQPINKNFLLCSTFLFKQFSNVTLMLLPFLSATKLQSISKTLELEYGRIKWNKRKKWGRWPTLQSFFPCNLRACFPMGSCCCRKTCMFSSCTTRRTSTTRIWFDKKLWNSNREGDLWLDLNLWWWSPRYRCRNKQSRKNLFLGRWNRTLSSMERQKKCFDCLCARKSQIYQSNFSCFNAPPNETRQPFLTNSPWILLSFPAFAIFV